MYFVRENGPKCNLDVFRIKLKHQRLHHKKAITIIQSLQMTNSNVIDTKKKKSIYEMCQKELNICFCKLLMCIVWILVQFCFLLIFSFWNTHDRQSNFMLCLFWNTWFLKIKCSFRFRMFSEFSGMSSPVSSWIECKRYKPLKIKF